MTCAEISALVPLHSGGELDAARASAFAAHLESCPACALDADLRACVLGETIETDALERRVRQRIVLETRRRHWSFAAAALAAIVLITVLGYRTIFHQPVPRVYAAAARDHHFEVIDRQPRRWRTDIPSVQELAQRQGISPSTISALAPAGYRLEEGKLCRLDGRLFLHLVYTDGAKSFSVFLRDDNEPGGGGKRILASRLGAEHVAGFQDGNLEAMIVTNQPGNAALLFAKSAAAAI